MTNKIAPSILSADFTRLGEQLREVSLSGADMLHFDVMDGKFVPQISFGEPVLKSIRKEFDMEIDVHLMIFDPLKNIESFANAGADRITVHMETGGVRECIDRIHSLGLKAAVSLKPDTPVEAVFPYLNDLEMVLMMTVYPGFGGQSFLPESPERIRKLKSEIDRLGLETEIQVDGGIDRNTISLAREAGANVFVSGSSVFRGDIAANMKALRAGLE